MQVSLSTLLSFLLVLRVVSKVFEYMVWSFKKVKYEVSLEYTKMREKDQWWSKIEPYSIYLGALPLKNKNHLEQICALDVKAVLSAVEDFELEPGWFNTPVQVGDWSGKGVDVKRIQAVDFCPLTLEQLKEGVAYIGAAVDQGIPLYVHCKAGIGRSAALVIAYLMDKTRKSFEEVYSQVKGCRPLINLNAGQKSAVLAYFTAT
jgi:protein-tyrosine phosphatase